MNQFICKIFRPTDTQESYKDLITASSLIYMVSTPCLINCICNTVWNAMTMLMNAITIYFYIVLKYIVEFSMNPCINLQVHT